MNPYVALKKKFSDELNAFEDIFFAFSSEQLTKGLDKLQVTKEEIVSIGAGGFVKKTSLQAFSDMMKRSEQGMKDFLTDPDNLLTALVYELQNHEYSYTGDPTDALESLGLSMDDIPVDVWKKALSQAREE